MSDFEADFLLITNIPSFYKVRLWNEIAKTKKVFAIFVSTSDATRNGDFVSVKPIFPYSTINGTGICSTLKVIKYIYEINYSRLIVSGWESLPEYIAPFFSPKKKNAIICESSIYEYKRNRVKDFLKHICLSRYSLAYPAGHPHERLLRTLGYKNKTIISGGCGLLNYIEQPKPRVKEIIHHFIYVGRLVKVKNLEFLIRAFNNIPDMELTIIGFGPQEEYLKSIASPNINFTGAVDNVNLTKYYQAADVFILPSKSEPWGLVVEEALNNGIPVIVSDKVGCREDLVTDGVGFVIESNNQNSLINCIKKISDISVYNELARNVSKLDFEDRAKNQILSFAATMRLSE